MDTEDCRKRPAEFDFSSNSPKRLCQESTGSSASESPRSNAGAPMDPPMPTLLSIKEMLSVPLEYVFHQCPPSGFTQTSPSQSQRSQPHRLKPLLSRSEAACFIRIHCLALEADSLLQLSAQALVEQVEWMTFHDELVKADVQPLRALLPILRTLGQTFVHARLQQLQADLTNVLTELESLAENLRQSREASWNTADALMDAGVNNTTAQEKRHLGDIQDELAHRIDAIVRTTMIGAKAGKDAEDEGGDIFMSDSPQSMSDFCHQVWNSDSDSSVAQSPLRESSASQNSQYVGEPMMGKENAPSQHSHSSHSAAGPESPACPGAATQHAAMALSAMAFERPK